MSHIIYASDTWFSDTCVFFLQINCCCILLKSGSVVPGAGAFEIVAHAQLMKYKDTVKGRARLGMYLQSKSAFISIRQLRYEEFVKQTDISCF